MRAYELSIAYLVAGLRQSQNLLRNTTPDWGSSNDCWDSNVVGCIGEMALAKALDKFWSGSVGDYGAKDVGGFQVRASEGTDGLRIRQRDKDEDLFFHAKIAGMYVYIFGPMTAGEAKRIGVPRFNQWYVPLNLLPIYLPGQTRD